MKRLILLLAVILFLSGCGKVAVETELQVRTSDQNALISVLVANSNRHNADLWENDKLLGFLYPGTVLQFEVPPGEHVFIFHWRHSYKVMRADVSAGKHYVVTFSGIRENGAKITPIDGRRGNQGTARLFKRYRPMTVADTNRAKRFEASVQKHIAKFRETDPYKSSDLFNVPTIRKEYGFVFFPGDR